MKNVFVLQKEIESKKNFIERSAATLGEERLAELIAELDSLLLEMNKLINEADIE